MKWGRGESGKAKTVGMASLKLLDGPASRRLDLAERHRPWTGS